MTREELQNQTLADIRFTGEGASFSMPLAVGNNEHDAVAAEMLRALAEDSDVEAATYDRGRRVIDVRLTGKAQGFQCAVVVGEL